jgi:formate hydrogenlyase subunit 6/NADH:ubiquinone oxidoreductase subunit I
MKIKAIPERCSGCCVCRLACGLSNYGQVNPAMSAIAISGRFPEPGTYEINLCVQCGACAEACPVQAIQEENGVYSIQAETCIGCGECVPVCPTRILFLHPGVDTPIKCTLCKACVELCPRNALTIEA